jgi:hypothetical protein
VRFDRSLDRGSILLSYVVRFHYTSRAGLTVHFKGHAAGDTNRNVSDVPAEATLVTTTRQTLGVAAWRHRPSGVRKRVALIETGDGWKLSFTQNASCGEFGETAHESPHPLYADELVSRFVVGVVSRSESLVLPGVGAPDHLCSPRRRLINIVSRPLLAMSSLMSSRSWW